MSIVSHYRDQSEETRPARFSFLLLPGFSLLSFSSAVEPLHKVNRVLGRTVYSPTPVSIDGEPVYSSAAVSVQVAGSLDVAVGADALFICGSSAASSCEKDNEIVVSWLKQTNPLPMALGGIASGSCVLAKAGELNGHRAASSCPGLISCYPEVHFSRNLYELDAHRYTCSGGAAAMDMTLALIGKRQGIEVSALIAELLAKERQGSYFTGLATIKAEGIKTGPEPKLRDALDLMLANIDEPLGADELAIHVGISRRQLERLFRKNLNTAPSKYYLQLRLEAARKLLRKENLPVVQVALACGFSNASHFSTAYRNHFKLTPREERQLSKDNGINELKHSLPVSPVFSA